jgi:Protein of unknown function (DUF2914)
MKLLSLFLAASLVPIGALAETTTTSPAQSAPASAATQAAPAASEQSAPATNAAPAQKDVAEQEGFSKGSVVRSIFTKEVKDREPTDKLQTTDTSKVFYFTELRDMNGQTATHRWEHEGKVVSEIKFNVGSNRWRVWSSKSFIPQTSGDWKVSVLNGAGEVISEENLKVTAAAETEKAMPEASEAAPAAASSPSVQPAPAAGTSK